MGTRLPIFPLGTVLVPGLVLPLRIFEPRYRVLVEALRALPEGATRQFGVIALRGNESEVGAAAAGDGEHPVVHPNVYSVGCTAELREVTADEEDEGVLHIVTVGESRFRLTGFDDEAGTPYHTGIVDLLPEEDGPGDLRRLGGQVTTLFAEYRALLGVEVSTLPTDPAVVSYLVSAAMVLTLADRQALLEAPTTAERLVAERGLLRRECSLIKAFRCLPATELARAPMNWN